MGSVVYLEMVQWTKRVCERRCERPHKSVEYESLKRLQMEAQ